MDQATLGTLLAIDGPYERALKARHLVKTPEALSSLRRGLKHLMGVDIAKLTRRDLVEALDKLSHLPGAQYALRKFTRSLLEWAVNSGLVQANVLAGMRMAPRTRAQKLQEAAGRRALTNSEIAALWQAATGKFGALVKLALVTGMRRNEVSRPALGRYARPTASCCCREVTKTGDAARDPAHVVDAQYSQRAAAHDVAIDLPEQPDRQADVGLVFDENPTGAWGRRGSAHGNMHDLRRTCRTLMTLR